MHPASSTYQVLSPYFPSEPLTIPRFGVYAIHCLLYCPVARLALCKIRPPYNPPLSSSSTEVHLLFQCRSRNPVRRWKGVIGVFTGRTSTEQAKESQEQRPWDRFHDIHRLDSPCNVPKCSDSQRLSPFSTSGVCQTTYMLFSLSLFHVASHSDLSRTGPPAWKISQDSGMHHVNAAVGIGLTLERIC